MTVGVILGAVPVSSFNNGVTFGLPAGSGDVKLGWLDPDCGAKHHRKGAESGFCGGGKAVTPSVAAINVRTTGKEKQKKMLQDFFHFFGPRLLDHLNPSPRKALGPVSF